MDIGIHPTHNIPRLRRLKACESQTFLVFRAYAAALSGKILSVRAAGSWGGGYQKSPLLPTFSADCQTGHPMSPLKSAILRCVKLQAFGNSINANLHFYSP
jgi:hypothetical protein